MENKNNNKRISSFLRREGFYVVLFLCLCIIATVAAMATRNSKKVEERTQTSQNAKVNLEEPKSVTISQKDKEINNAIQVQDNTKNTGIEIPTKQEIAVSKTTEPTFVKPVEGTIAMKYSQTPVWWETSQTYRPNFGINIKAEAGTKVKATANGEVKLVEQNGSFGNSVTIYHSESGKTTFYGNLDKDIKVKKGDIVTQGQQIGKVGNSSLRGISKEEGMDFLHFQVLKNSKDEPQFASENPEKYVKY